MQKTIVSLFGPGQSFSSKRRRAEDEDDTATLNQRLMMTILLALVYL